MNRHQLIAAIVATAVVLLLAVPRSEAGHFSFSFFFPIPIVTSAPPSLPCPAPVPPPCKTWIPGHYEMQTQQAWVPGACETVWVPPTYQKVWDGCRWARVLAEPGHYVTIQHPGHYENQEVRVWVPGHYEL